MPNDSDQQRDFLLEEPWLTVLSDAVISNDYRVCCQCQKALTRSRLWDADTLMPRSELPSAGDMVRGLDKDFDGTEYDAGNPEHMNRTNY